MVKSCCYTFLLCLLCCRLHAQKDIAMAQGVLQGLADELQLQPSDYDCLQLKSKYTSQPSGVTHLYYIQCHQELEVHGAVLNLHYMSDGSLLTWGSRLVPDLVSRIQDTLPSLDQADALQQAALQLGYDWTGAPVVKETKGDIAQTIVFEKGALSVEDIPVRLVWQPTDAGEVRLAWDLNLYEADGENWWSVRVDANTGAILSQDNWVVSCQFGSPPAENLPQTPAPCAHAATGLPPTATAGTYHAFPPPLESPSNGSRQLLVDPSDSVASPFGWHDTDGLPGAEYTITRGNSAYVQLDNDNNNNTFGISPEGGPSLVFDFPLDLTQPPASYQQASMANLFHWTNYLHDFVYHYGFNEQSGNFQFNNYGRGGTGNDPVIVDAQDAGSVNNANFATPPEGGSPRLQVYLWNYTSPMRDAALDNGITSHEFAHGISNRLTGGPAITYCLNNAEQMGEGWSDYYLLITTMPPGSNKLTPRGIATYVLGQPTSGTGLRPTPYTTNMAVNGATYNSIKTLSYPHGTGYVWCTMIWDLTWALVDKYGLNAGLDKAIRLINEGMRLQPCHPGFVDARNAILAADQALNGGANTCDIWTVFARRGLGLSATQGSSASRLDGTEAFDVPASCALTAWPSSLSLCQGASAQSLLRTGYNYGNVTFSAIAGVPPGVQVSFSQNPSPSPGSTTVTIAAGPSVAPGVYTITLQAAGTNATHTRDISLQVLASPGVPVLQHPQNDSMMLTLSPLLAWTAPAAADSFLLQVATDSSFDVLVASLVMQDTFYQMQSPLAELTIYYWRVRIPGSCTNSSFSAPFSFSIPELTCHGNSFMDSGGLTGEYANDEDYSVTFCPDNPGTALAVTFSAFATAGPADVLAVYDGLDTAALHLGSFSGVQLPAQAKFTASNPSGCLTIRFVSDSTGTASGWEAGISCGAFCNAVSWYPDADGDGYGSAQYQRFLVSCSQPAGWASNNLDCDDASAAFYPTAIELCNGLDDNCDGNPEAVVNTWTGQGVGSDWTDPGNWSDGLVPLSCQDVLIPAGFSVFVPAGATALGRSLEVAPGAELIVHAEAELLIAD